MEHRCGYCKEPYAEFGRFAALERDFCTPECAAAYDRYYNSGRAHVELELRWGRVIAPAPSHSVIVMRHLRRADWLPVCRAQLSETDAAVAASEACSQQKKTGPFRKK